MRAAIIIPVYNAESFISECLKSMEAQTEEDFSVICVDDGSTDSSAQIVQRVVKKDPRFHLIRQENKGASSARNRGYDAAQAEYVTFVDADDAVSSDFLEKLLAAAVRDQADVAVANKMIITSRGHTTKKKPVLKAGSVRGMDLHHHGGLLRHIAPHAKLYRTEFLRRHGLRFFEGVTYEDYIHWLDVLTKDPVVTRVPDFLYSYKKNPTSISSGSQRLKPFNIESRLVQTRECLRIAKDSGSPELYEKVKSAQLRNSVFRHIIALSNTKDREAAVTAFAQLQEGMQPYKSMVYRELSGWRRLLYKLLLEGDLDDLLKIMRYVEGRRELSTRVERYATKPNLYISRNELPSIATAKEYFFNVADLIR